MQHRLPLFSQQWHREEFGDHHRDLLQSCSQESLGTPRRHPAKILRRQMLESELFKHGQEIRSLDDGYALRFDRSDDLDALLGTMAEYIVLESLNSSQFTVTIDEAPEPNGFWLRLWYGGKGTERASALFHQCLEGEEFSHHPRELQRRQVGEKSSCGSGSKSDPPGVGPGEGYMTRFDSCVD